MAVIAVPALAWAAPGDLDTSFDGDGKVTTAVGSDDRVGSIAIQGDGKIVAAGDSDNGNDEDFALVRYNADGSLDTSFGGDGKVTTDFGFGDDSPQSVVIQGDGKIVAAGYSYNGGDADFALVRYNADGSLDTSFDGDGMVTTAVGSGIDYGISVAIQVDGKIVVAGLSNNGIYDHFALVRYNADGSLDTSFDGDGKVTMAFAVQDVFYSVAIQGDAKIVAAGYSSSWSDPDFALVRYNADGSLDTSFDGDGIVTTAIGSSTDFGQSLAIQVDGKLVVAGTSNNGTYGNFAVVRYNADGSLDTSFDGDGKLTTAVGSKDDFCQSVAIQGDGKIVAAGYSSDGGDSTSLDKDFALVRYNADGSLDTSFDGDGVVTTDFGSSNDLGTSVAIQSDGKIVAAGVSGIGGNYEFALVRYGGVSSVCGEGISAAGASCDDGDACTVNDSCGAGGTCVGEVLVCNDEDPCTQDSCDPVTGSCSFVLEPANVCRTAARAGLQFKTAHDGKAGWKWQRGQATSCGDFGAPDADTVYDVCVYDGIGSGKYALATSFHLSANATWTMDEDCEWSYSNSLATADGIRRFDLSPGDEGRASIQLELAGLQTPMPLPVASDRMLNMNPAVTVQMFNGSGICWESQFTQAYRNTPTNFRTKLKVAAPK